MTNREDWFDHARREFARDYDLFEKGIIEEWELRGFRNHEEWLATQTEILQGAIRERESVDNGLAGESEQ